MDALTFDYIKTATAIATFLISERLEATVTNIRSYFGTNTSLATLGYKRKRFNPRLGYSVTTINSAAVQFEQLQEVAFIAKLLADPDLLNDLVKDADRSIIDFRDCLEGYVWPQERDPCYYRAQDRVCEILTRISPEDADELPTDFLKDQWADCRCQG